MLFALVLGITLGVVGITLIRQWAEGVMIEQLTSPPLSPTEFPRLASPSRTRRPMTRGIRPISHVVRRAA